MNQEHAFCLAAEKLLGIAIPKRAQLIRVLYCEIGRLLSHLLNVTTQAHGCRRAHPAAVGLRGAREADGVLRARLGLAHARRLFPRRRRASGFAAEAHRRHRAFCDPFLKVCDDLEELLTENRIFKQRNVDIGVVKLDGRLGLGLLRRHGARLGRGLGSAQGAALRVLLRARFRHPDRQERRLLRSLLHPHGGDAPVGAHHEAVRREAAHGRRAGSGRRSTTTRSCRRAAPR